MSEAEREPPIKTVWIERVQSKPTLQLTYGIMRLAQQEAQTEHKVTQCETRA
jgi:hypothetical protein